MKVVILWALAFTFCMSAITQLQMQELYRNKQRFEKLASEKKGNWQQEATKLLNAIKKYDTNYVQENQDLLKNIATKKPVTSVPPVKTDTEIDDEIQPIVNEIQELLQKLQSGKIKNTDDTWSAIMQEKIETIKRLNNSLKESDVKTKNTQLINDFQKKIDALVKKPASPYSPANVDNKQKAENKIKYKKAQLLCTTISNLIDTLKNSFKGYSSYKDIDDKIKELSLLLDDTTDEIDKNFIRDQLTSLSASFAQVLVSKCSTEASILTTEIIKKESSLSNTLDSDWLNLTSVYIDGITQKGLLWKYIVYPTSSGTVATLKNNFSKLIETLNSFLDHYEQYQSRIQDIPQYNSLLTKINTTFGDFPEAYKDPKNKYKNIMSRSEKPISVNIDQNKIIKEIEEDINKVNISLDYGPQNLPDIDKNIKAIQDKQKNITDAAQSEKIQKDINSKKQQLERRLLANAIKQGPIINEHLQDFISTVNLTQTNTFKSTIITQCETLFKDFEVMTSNNLLWEYVSDNDASRNSNNEFRPILQNVITKSSRYLEKLRNNQKVIEDDATTREPYVKLRDCMSKTFSKLPAEYKSRLSGVDALNKLINQSL